MPYQNKVEISGLIVTPFQSMEAAVAAVFEADSVVKPGFALAMNAEKIMSSRTNPDVKEVLQMATLRYADGVGVVWALRRKGVQSAKIAGCEFWQKIMERAGENCARVFLVGASQEVLNKTVNKLQSENNVNIVGSQDGFFSTDDEHDIIEKIVGLKPEIITVAMGSPRQEKFISKCRELHPNAFYMGVGGTYDVYVGHVKRAPQWALRNNIEWLYRLFQSPKRVMRQKVLIVFIFLVLMGQI